MGSLFILCSRALWDVLTGKVSLTEQECSLPLAAAESSQRSGELSLLPSPAVENILSGRARSRERPEQERHAHPWASVCWESWAESRCEQEEAHCPPGLSGAELRAAGTLAAVQCHGWQGCSDHFLVRTFFHRDRPRWSQQALKSNLAGLPHHQHPELSQCVKKRAIKSNKIVLWLVNLINESGDSILILMSPLWKYSGVIFNLNTKNLTVLILQNPWKP